MTAKKKCLIVDDDSIVLDFFNFALGERAQFVYLNSGKDFMNTLYKHSFDMAFIDLGLPDIDGHELIKQLKAYNPDLPVVVISSSNDISDAITAFRLGALDYLTKPLDESLLVRIFKKAINQKELVNSHQILTDKVKDLSNNLIIGDSQKVADLKEDIKRLKGSDLDTLIVAESGCGKELVAKALNLQEGDSNRPYITLNCSAIPKELMESILFGHEKGAFTGADKKQIGKFELANNGDIFLDEIGTLSLDLQSKLLRVLQEREIEPVGAGLTKKIEFRVLAATNEDLAQMVKNGTFRKDLYFRLNKMILRVPPLRERKDDIPMLTEHFLKKKARKGLEKTISKEALAYLQQYTWPGNVRELENTIENLFFTARGTVIVLSDVERLGLDSELFGDIYEEEIETKKELKVNVDVRPASFDETLSLDENMMNFEKMILGLTLRKFKTKQEAAEHLKVDRKTLFRKVKIHGLE
jgi:DNA-binding NtrC family response regulator